MTAPAQTCASRLAAWRLALAGALLIAAAVVQAVQSAVRLAARARA